MKGIPDQLIRVVALKRGKVKLQEFQLKPGEKGLSLFAKTRELSCLEIVNAVRSAGKTGDLAAAVLKSQDILDSGLVIVRTQGRTPALEINDIHFEVRLSFLKTLWLAVRGSSPKEFFNERMSSQLLENSEVVIYD